MSLEDRLRRIEKMLSEILERLEKLERAAEASGLSASVAAEMALAFAVPVQEAVRKARLAVKALEAASSGGREPDPIERAIVEALAVKGPLTLRGLEREVRRLRGSASRAAIASRLRGLEELGVVRVERRGRRVVVSLNIDTKESL